MVHGRYGDFSVQVDGEEVVRKGALGFLGILPSADQVLGRVRSRLSA